MICFLSRSSFCSRNDCVNEECERNLTPRLKDLAERVKIDVCYSDFKTDSCGYRSKDDASV